MDSTDKFTRRRFLGLGAAVGASVVGFGSVVALRTAASRNRPDTATLEWSTNQACPGQTVTLNLTAPDLRPSQKVRLQLAVDHDGKAVGEQLHEVVAGDGAARLEIDIQLPYEDLIPGEYRYVARVSTGDLSVQSKPLVIHVKPYYLWA